MPDEVVRGIDVSVYMGEFWTWFVLRRRIRPALVEFLVDDTLTQRI